MQIFSSFTVSASKHDALVLQQFFCYTSRIINGGTFYVSFSNSIVLEGLQTMAITDRSQSGLPDDDCLAFLKVDILNIHIHPAHSLWQFQPEYIKLRLRTHLVVCQRTAMLFLLLRMVLYLLHNNYYSAGYVRLREMFQDIFSDFDSIQVPW